MRPFALSTCLLVGANLALAQEGPRSERLYLNATGVLLGSPRVTALGGAYVGIAEGAEGFSSNLAALAHRGPHLERDWDVGGTFSWLDVPLGSVRDRDLDNDGARDDAAATRQLLGGVLLQYKRFGLGWYFRTTTRWYCALSGLERCPGSELLEVTVSNTALAGAVALGRDDFVLGLGLYGAEAHLAHHGDTRSFTNTGLEFDVLYRPHGLSYRVGVSVRPLVVGFYRPKPQDTPVLAGRPLFAAVVSPAVLSLGGSLKLGDGSHRYNRHSPATRRDILERFGEAWVSAEQPRDAPAGRWLLSGQVDLISPTENTVPVSSFIDLEVASGLREPEPVGRTLYVVPRVGVEHDTWLGRLRTRLGTYVEPSPFVDRLPRPHLTGGFELFVYEYWEKWALSGAFDVAPRYANVGLSVGFWR